MNVVILMKPSPTHTLQAFVRYLAFKHIYQRVWKYFEDLLFPRSWELT